MTDVSAFTIVRNEELLIAKHLAELARHATESVCVVQPSTDCTLMFAQYTATQLASVGLRCRVVEHAPERLGKEFSLGFALEQCAFDWCFNLDADETYVGRSPAEVIEGSPPYASAITLPHVQAVGCTRETWFKEEPVKPKVRLVHRGRLYGNLSVDLHEGLDKLMYGETVSHLPASEGRIVEYKAPWQHYVDQLFYEAEGSPQHEARQCRERLTPQALELGETAFRIDRRSRSTARHPSGG
jgi:hypothetical protein